MKSEEIWLVIGAEGMMGSALVACLNSSGKNVVETSRKRKLPSAGAIIIDLAEDITNIELPNNISIAYFCAAVSSLKECQENPRESYLVNVHNTIKLAKKLVDGGAFVVFPSSNLVFDGVLPFRKADELMCPLTEYGRQKAQVEKELLSMGDRSAVVRFTKVLGPRTVLFDKWIMDLRNGSPIHPFSDMVFSPVIDAFAVQALKDIGERQLSGIIQVSGEREITYEQAARYIAQLIGASPNLIEPILVKQSELSIESVPKHASLDISRLKEELQMAPIDVLQIIERVINTEKEEAFYYEDFG